MGLNKANPETTGILQPNDNDVLCGRGGSINAHAGNEQFRGLVEKYRRIYLNARFKQEKRLIASSIVDEIKALDPPGRFLAKDSATETWYSVGEEKARDKTSQALRENAPSLRAGGSSKKESSSKDATVSKDPNENSSPPQPVVPTNVQSAYYPPPQHPPPQQYPQWTPPPTTSQGPMLGPYSAAQQPLGSSPSTQNSQHPHPNMPYPPPQTAISSSHAQQMYSMQPPPVPVLSSMSSPMQTAQQQQQHHQQHAYGNRVIPGQNSPPLASQPAIEPPNTADIDMHRQDSHSPVPLRQTASESSPRMESPPAPIEVKSAQIEGVGNSFNFDVPQSPQPHQQQFLPNNANLPMPYSPIATQTSSAKKNVHQEESNTNNSIPHQESRMDDSMQVEDDNKSVASSSLLTQVASHIVGNWDLNVFCGNGLADTDLGALEAPRRETPSSRQRKKLDSTTPRSIRSAEVETPRGGSFNASSFFNPRASFTSDVNSMVASVDMNGDNKSTQGSTGWANGPASVDMNASKTGAGSTAWANGPASVDMHGEKSVQGSTAWGGVGSIASARSGASLGSRITGNASKDVKITSHDLAKVPSWEQSFRSMSFSSADSKDMIDSSMSSTSGAAKLDVEDGLFDEIHDVKLTIALQQKENAKALEVYHKRRRAADRSKTYRSGISGAADRFSFSRASHNAKPSAYNVGDYVPPDDGGLAQFPAGTQPQEIADYNLAMSLQKLDQVGAGTVQQWERILRKEREEEEARKLRNARSGYSLPTYRKS